MLSSEQCRIIDPSLANLSDDELSAAVEFLTGLAELLLEDWLANEGSKYRRGILDATGASPMMET